MAEAAGLVLGALGIAGLFSACIDVFEFVQVGRARTRDLEVLATKLENQKARFVIWGRTLRLDSADEGGGYDKRLDESVRKESVLKTMRLVARLFMEGDELTVRYGMRKEGASNAVTHQQPPGHPSPWRGMFHRVQERLNRNGKSPAASCSARDPSTFRWAIVDQRLFLALVGDLRELIDDLESLTRFHGLSEQKRTIVTYEIESMSDLASLALVRDAGENACDDLSDAATIWLHSIKAQADGIEDASVRDASLFPDHETFTTAHSCTYGVETVEAISEHAHELPILSDVPQNQRVMRQGYVRAAPEDSSGNPPRNLLNTLSISQEPFERFRRRNRALCGILSPQESPSGPMKWYQRVRDFAESLKSKEISAESRIANELKWISHLDRFTTFGPRDDSDMRHCIGMLRGPPESPYENGLFYVSMDFPPEYPFHPPQLRFLTRIYHPNINC